MTVANPGFGFAGEFELKKEFLLIKVSYKTGHGLDEIKNALNSYLPMADFFHTEIDKRWMVFSTH